MISDVRIVAGDLIAIGGASDHTLFEADGTMRFVGGAAVWDDLVMPISITKLGASAPAWTSFFGNLSQYTFDVDDYVEGAVELLHGYKQGTNLEVHAHIVTQGAEASKEARYTFEYWVANMNAASTSTETLDSQDVALTNANGHHQYVDLGSIDGTSLQIGAIVCFMFKRVALADGGDPTSDPFVVSVGIHIEHDTAGSRSETAK